MTNPQGTQWESELVGAAGILALPADRYPKRGQSSEPDVWIGQPNQADTIPVLSWKRLVKSGGKRRKPDGERDVVVMRTKDFLRLINLSPASLNVDVQCKWTQRLNVTRELGGLVEWMEEHREGFAG